MSTDIKKNIHFIGLFVIGLVCGIMFTIALKDSPQGTTKKSDTPVFTELDMSSATLTFRESPMPVFTLDKGVYENDEVRMSAGIIDQYIAYADLNSDGRRDGAALVYVNTGGTGVFVNLVVLYSTASGFAQPEPVFLGDRVEVQSLAIDSATGVITVTIKDRDMGDTMTDAPSVTKTYMYKLQGGALVRI